MPNWVYNSLTIEGDPALIADVKQKLNAPFVQKHDSWNMQTQQMEVKDYAYNNPIFAFHNIYNHTQAGISDEDYMKQPDHSKSPLDFSGNNWYDWNVNNWGTKWDVAVRDDDDYPETELMEESKTSLAYRFNTAWSPPLPAIQKLSFDYPTLSISLSYQEETGWGGETDFVAGVIVSDQNYGSQCRDCDSYDTMEYCDNDCGEICSECNYLGEADLDIVADCDIHKVYLDEEHVPDYRMDEING
jgi:hypothetical protein